MSVCNECRFKQVNGKERCKTNKIFCQRKGSKFFHKEVILDEDHPDHDPELECSLNVPYGKDWIGTALRYSNMGHCALCYYHVWVERDGKVVDICEIDGLLTDKIMLHSDKGRKKANHMENTCPKHKMKMRGRR